MKYRVLFIDDERRAVTPYFSALARYEIACFLAQDGDVALRELEKAPFDIIVMDIMFPAGNIMGSSTPHKLAGLHLLQRIRDGLVVHCPATTPVIVLTAVMNGAVEAQILQLGVAGYLKKPVEHQSVIDSILGRIHHEPDQSPQ